MLDKTERLDLEVFGRRLIDAGDLDPIYNAVAAANMELNQLRRWLLAYWCCYNAGLSSWLSERTGAEFWDAMTEFAANETISPIGGKWPRGRERRHFRGQKCVNSVLWFRANFSCPEAPVDSLILLAGKHSGRIPYRLIKNAVTVWPLFGPWIAFKVGDMLERLMSVPIDFTDSGITLYDSPTKAAQLWASQQKIDTDSVVNRSVNHLRYSLGDMKAPPAGDRPLGLQEFETILCKWKAHQDGIYPVGIDTQELVHALQPWAVMCETAYKMALSLDHAR